MTIQKLYFQLHFPIAKINYSQLAMIYLLCLKKNQITEKDKLNSATVYMI